MATMWISEYQGPARQPGAVVPVPMVPGLAYQAVTFTATSTQSALLNAGTEVVRVRLSANGYILFGTNPTAAATSHYMLANEAQDFGVPPGGAFKIAAITG